MNAMTPRPELPAKPLAHKNYGSIPHLSGSRLGPSDRKANPGQEDILTIDSRGRRIIVTEKLDGSNMGVARIGDRIFALNRAGYEARTSPYEFQKLFNIWVMKREKLFLSLLKSGERVVGEWMLQAHGTRYRIEREEDLFVVFDIMKGMERILCDDLWKRCREQGLRSARVLSDGPAISIKKALTLLGPCGHHGALEAPEGAVWRAEYRGRCDFLAKYVYPGKMDGRYLPELTGSDPLWLYPPEKLLET